MKLLVFLLFISGISFAQEYQWADKVIAVSSEFKYDKYPQQYTAQNVLGPPNFEPGNDACPSAWAPSKKSNPSGEYIIVGFAKPQRIQQVLISENFNAGSVNEVVLIDINGKNTTVYTDENPQLQTTGRKLSITFPKTSTAIKQVKVSLATHLVDGHNQIDCIGIADHQEKPGSFIHLIQISNTSEKESLGTNVNSNAIELLPVITPDGESIYYVRQNHPNNFVTEKQDIYMAKFDKDNNPLPAQHVGKPLNTNSNNGLLSITPDGNQALLMNVYYADGSMDVGLSIAKKDGDNWLFPEKLHIDSFENKNQYGEYFLANSGNILLSCVERTEGRGQKDVFVSFIKADGSWTKPKSLGATINTTATEMSPFLASDNKTLYFASKGHPGYGSTDIFMSRRLDDTWENWSVPINLGPTINSAGFDAYYTIPAKGDYAYFSSEGIEKTSDIYRIRLPKELQPNAVTLVEGVVYNKKTNEPIAAKINYYNLESGELIGSANSSSKDGFYKLVLPSGANYGFNAVKEDFLPVSKNLNIPEKSEYQVVRNDLYLTPIEVGAEIIINNLYFDFAKYSLRKESKVELNQLAEILKSHPSMSVQIQGHTDDKGELDFNERLSYNRAKSVMNFLIELGVPANQLTAKGFGETDPIVANDSDENRQLNRRVEFVVLAL